MSRSIELPDEEYARLERAAELEGVTPAEWVARHLPACTRAQPCANGTPAKTMADLFAGRVGVVASGGEGRLSENTGERFADLLVEQRRAGRL